MARSFPLCFQGREKLGRIQRAALNLAVPGASGKRAAASRRAAARRGANASRDGASPSLGLGRWEASRQFTDGLGRRLAFARYIPPGVPRQGMPLVVMLHGCRQTALSFAQGSRMNQWADAAGFMVLYPQQSMARQVQRCWRWFQPDALHGGGEADLIAALVRSEVGRHGLDPTRVYIAGLSAGAGMAALVALRHPQLVAALAMHSGPVTGDARRRGPANHAPGRAQAPASAAGKRGQSGSAAPGHAGHHPAGPARSRRGAAQRAPAVRPVPPAQWPAPQDVPVERVLGLGTDKSYRRVDMLKDRRAVVRLCEITHVEHAWSGGDPAVNTTAGAGRTHRR